MEEQRFDELTKALVRPTSRRQMLKVLGAAVVGGWAATRGAPRVLATGNCMNQGNSCAAEQCCEGLICAFTTTSNSTKKFCCNPSTNPVCGNGAHAQCCPTGANCVSGQCVCPGGTIPCPPTTTNPFGACCASGTACCNGICCLSGQVCSGGACCTPITTCPAGACGTISNGCGGTLNCGSCPPCQTCSSGTCINAPNGTGCTGIDKCFQTYMCQAGVCTGSNPVVCTPSDQCHVAGTCDPTSGACSNPPASNGTPCNAGTCTTGDTCQNGACTPGSTSICTSVQHCCAGTCTADCAIAGGTSCCTGSDCSGTGAYNPSCQRGCCCENNLGPNSVCSSTLPCCDPEAVCMNTICCFPVGIGCSRDVQCCSGTCLDFKCT